VTPWDGDARAEDQDIGEPVQRTGVRQRNSRENRGGVVVEQRGHHKEQPESPAGGGQGNHLREEPGSHQRVENENSAGRQAAKRKAKTNDRHRKRDQKRRTEVTTTGYSQKQRELQLIVGEGISREENYNTVPWEHRMRSS
jgi:hypothetical protein